MYCKDCKFPTDKNVCMIWKEIIDRVNGSCSDLELKKQFESYPLVHRVEIVIKCGIQRDDISPLLSLNFIPYDICLDSNYCDYRDSIPNNRPAPFNMTYVCKKIGECPVNKKSKTDPPVRFGSYKKSLSDES